MTLLVLRPRASVSMWLQCTRRAFSSAQSRQSRLTVAVQGPASKASVLNHLRDQRASLWPSNSSASDQEGADTAAVVLASPDLALWLEDDAFVSALLGQLPLSPSSMQVSVLSAVVDGICPSPSRSSQDLSGLSILHGPGETVLPGLWTPGQTEAAHGSGSGSGSIDREAAITAELGPLGAASGPIRMTVPLANTVFQNGRRATLLASRWGLDGTYKRQGPVEERSHQLIVPSAAGRADGGSWHSAAVVPLLAVTAARRIAAGLGNIVRQVALEEDGPAAPASRELESAIPALLAARRQMAEPSLADGPLAVWGLVVPPDALPLYRSVQSELAPGTHVDIASEQRAAAQAAPVLPALLAAGCRLHRILSGGGGWGAKQGLLSLDPETAHGSALESQSQGQEEDDAMASFLRSLRGETAARDSDFLATPGAHVQFFVSPLRAEEINVGTDADASIILGVQPGGDGSSATGPGRVALRLGHFGAVSHHGIFLARTPSARTPVVLRSKLDAPFAHVWEACRRPL